MHKFKLSLAISAALLLGGAVISAEAAQAQSATQEYRIAAGDLDGALSAFAARSRLQVIYPPKLASGKATAGLSGSFTPQQALSRLLQGTGLRAESVNASTFVLKTAPIPKKTPAPPPATPAAGASSTPAPTELDKVLVTGSLIPKAAIETASPTLKITAEDISRQGFATVYDALKALPIATGAVQGPQGASTYTTGAQALSLFGLDPGFTLVMVDGHPLPDYPLLYNGASNFTDLSGIPVAMVERIDIVPGNQSAVYGSSAIAGVVNIILKKHIDGLQVSFRSGDYSAGSGDNQRVEAVGSKAWFDDRLNLTYGFQYSNQSAIYANDHALTATTASNPTTPVPVANPIFRHEVTDPVTGRPTYVTPPGGAAGCEPVKHLFDNSVYYAQAPAGFFCGSTAAGYRTMMNEQRQYVGYLSASFALNDNAELYGSALYSLAQYKFAPLGGFTWLPNIANFGHFIDANDGSDASAWRVFAPEEQDYDQSAARQPVHSYQTVFGLRGNVDDSDWAYDFYVDRAQQIVKNRQLHPLKDKIEAFFQRQFLGPQQGFDAATGYPIYTPNWNNFYQPITPADFRSFSDYVQTRSSSSMQHATAQLNNNHLFTLPAGDVGMAAQLQVGHQTWDNPTDPRVVASEFWGLSGTQGNGTRDNYAGAVEFNVPLTSMLTADVAARYDNYKFAGRNEGKATYRASLEFRPLDSLLLRANYGTAFRAPDMGRIFLGPSGTYLAVTDYYACDTRQPGVPLENCTYYDLNIAGEHAGNKDLKNITAKSWGIGAVWSPNSNFNLHADYLKIDIADEVDDLSVDQLMQDEAQCRQGGLDSGSPTCRDTAARVIRDSLGNLQRINFGPINVSTEKVETVTLGATYRVPTERIGNFSFGANYNNMLDHTRVRYAGDPTIDLLRDPRQSTEFKNILNANVDWRIGNWNTTLYGIRYGSTPNYMARRQGYAANGAGRLDPWTLYNMSVGYQLPANVSVLLSVNNLFDKDPPKDNSYSRWPYYNNGNYNIYGRSFSVEIRWALGGDKH